MMRLDDRNPFEVRSHFDSDIQEESRSTNSRAQQRLQRANIIYRSQQDQPYSRKSQPSTPPTLRHRGRSLGPDSSGGSPTRIDMRSWPLSTNSDKLLRVEEEVLLGDSTPRRSSSPEGPATRLIRTDDEHFTALEPVSYSPSIQTSQNSRQHFDPDIIPSSVGRTDVEMAQESGHLLEDARTPTRSGGRRLSISSTSTKSLHNDSPISVRTVSRRHSIAEIESPTFKTPTRSRRKSSLGRVLRDDGSLSSGRISSLPESSPMGIDWSQSLETPAKKRQSQGAAKTPITNVIQRLRGLPTTPKGEEQSSAGEFTDWNPSLETPPRKVSLIEKHDISESRISAKVLDELRGVPSSSRPPPQQPAEKQPIVSSQDEDGSFYSATSSILSDDDDDYQNAGVAGAVIVGENTDQEQAQGGGGSDDATANDNYPAESETSPMVSSLDHVNPEAGIVTITSEGAGTLPALSVQELVEGSPIVDSLMESQEFSESQEDMFDGFTSAEINHALMSRSTQGSHHFTQPEESHGSQTGTLSTTSVGPLALPRGIAHPYNTTPMSPIGFRSASGRSNFQMSADRLKAARRLFEDDSRVVTGGRSQVENDTSVRALASNMLEVAGTFGLEDVDAEDISLESGSTERGGHMEIGERQQNESHQELPEVESEDDFGNIRFSQLDDGFNVVPEPTQKPKKRPSISSTTKRTPLIGGDLDWMARSSDMLGDLLEADDLAPMNRLEAASHQETRHQVAPPIMGGGFSSAGGRRLGALSSAALTRAARMFADDEDGVPERNLGPESVVPERRPAHAGGFTGLNGFSSAGKKPHPQISAASKERAMRMMQNSKMDMDHSGFQESTGSAAISFSSVPPDAERSVFMPPHIGASGFASGSGKKVAPVSNAALEKWSKEFIEGSDDSCNQLEHPSQQLSGFSSGSGRKLAPVSQAVVERWSKEFSDHCDGPDGLRETMVPTKMPSGRALGGFSSGGGKKLAPVSKAAMDKWFNELAKEVDDSESRRASDPRRPQALATPAPEVGFASGTGKALAPISKAAQARAYSFLELEQPVALQETSLFKNSAAHSRLSLPSSAPVSGSGYSSESSSSRPPPVSSHPPISTHMQNLKMKTLRGSSKGPLSLPGLMKPVLKSGVTPYRSPVQFKSPLRTPIRPPISDSVVAAGPTLRRDPGNSEGRKFQDSTTSTPSAQSSVSKKMTTKRPSLHPTARMAPAAPIPSHVQHSTTVQSCAPVSYSPVFNMQGELAQRLWWVVQYRGSYPQQD